MTNWNTVFLYELTRNIRRKAFLFMTFGVPLIIGMLVFGYTIFQEVLDKPSKTEDSTEAEFEDAKPIGYVDLTAYFTAPTADNPFAPYVTAYPDIEAGQAALHNDEINALYVIEEDYFESGIVTQWMEQFNFTNLTSDLIKAYLLNEMAEGSEPAVVARLHTPILITQEQRIATDGSIDENDGFGENFVLVYVFAFTLMISTFTASGYLLQSVVEEKENNTIEIILTSVKPFALLLGKTLAMGLLGLFQIGVWATAATVILILASANIPDLGAIEVKPAVLAVAIIYFVLGFGFVGAVFAAIGSLANNARDGSQLAGWVVFPIIIPLFFTVLFAEEPNSSIPLILSLIPFTAPLAMVMRVAVTDVPLYQIILSMLLTAGAAVLGIWLAGRLFRVNSLLRGSAPRLRDIPKLIWEA